MHFSDAKFLRNYLKGTGDMVIFVLLCKITHSFMHASMLINRIIMHPVAYQTIYLSYTFIHVPTTFM